MTAVLGLHVLCEHEVPMLIFLKGLIPEPALASTSSVAEDGVEPFPLQHVPPHPAKSERGC